MVKKRRGLLSQCKAFLMPLSVDAEGKLCGGFGGILLSSNDAIEPTNVACDNSPCSNPDCINGGCINVECNNVGCTNIPVEVSTTTDKVVKAESFGLLL